MRKNVSYFLFEPCSVTVTMSGVGVGSNRSERMSMRPQQFRQWRKSLGLKQKEAAELLGLKKRMIQYYEKGERDGKSIEIPKYVRLACYAVGRGVYDFDGVSARDRN